ncbi:hypothetical protein, partial [Escherichia coli]|uniref:hypothetical protein n=1 Tax=Escherichia coli TaxID=562 RepID=UPI003D780B39
GVLRVVVVCPCVLVLGLGWGVLSQMAVAGWWMVGVGPLPRRFMGDPAAEALKVESCGLVSVKMAVGVAMGR